MKKEYNRATMSDMPMEDSLNPSVTRVTTEKKTVKPKINAIGKKATAATKAKSTKTDNKQGSKPKTKLVSKSENLQDLEKLNEDNIKTYSVRSKRSKVVIVLLSVMLVIAIAVIAVYISITKLKTNCTMYLHGNVSATILVDGMELEEFRAPSNLQGNRVLRLDIKLKIEESGSFNIKFIPKCYQKGVLLENTLAYIDNYPDNQFMEGGDGYYYSEEAIEGNQTISLCSGIVLDYFYEDSLNIDNFKMEFHIYIEKV